MADDIEVLETWVFICVIIASIGTTMVPFIYSFFPWRLRPIGRLFMLQSLSFALAMDLTTLFMIWTPKNILVLFWIDALVLTFVAASTLSMASWLMGRMCYFKNKEKQNAS